MVDPLILQDDEKAAILNLPSRNVIILLASKNPTTPGQEFTVIANYLGRSFSQRYNQYESADR
jgi:hypothetical protein